MQGVFRRDVYCDECGYVLRIYATRTLVAFVVFALVSKATVAMARGSKGWRVGLGEAFAMKRTAMWTLVASATERH